MVYPYAVKHNGQYYAAGQEVPNKGTSAPVVEKTEKVVETQETQSASQTDDEVKRRGRKPKTED